MHDIELPSPQLTWKLKIGRRPGPQKGKSHPPTIHFQGLSGYVRFRMFQGGLLDT